MTSQGPSQEMTEKKHFEKPCGHTQPQTQPQTSTLSEFKGCLKRIPIILNRTNLTVIPGNEDLIAISSGGPIVPTSAKQTVNEIRN